MFLSNVGRHSVSQPQQPANALDQTAGPSALVKEALLTVTNSQVPAHFPGTLKSLVIKYLGTEGFRPLRETAGPPGISKEYGSLDSPEVQDLRGLLRGLSDYAVAGNELECATSLDLFLRNPSDYIANSDFLLLKILDAVEATMNVVVREPTTLPDELRQITQRLFIDK